MVEDERPPNSGDEDSDSGEQTDQGPGHHQEPESGQPGPDSGQPEPRSGHQGPSSGHRELETGSRDSGSYPADTGSRRRQQTDRGDGGGDGVWSHIERVQEVVVWPESVIVGVSTWLIGLFLTAIPLWWFDFSSDLGEGTLELAVWVYVESTGGTVGDQALFVTEASMYGTFDSNAFGLGPAIHALVPMLVLVVAGYILAGRHVSAGRTGRPLEVILAGGSIAIWFSITLLIAAVITTGGGFSVNLGETLVTTPLYAGVFASLGAAIRSRAGLSSVWGLLAGVGAFLVGLLLWVLVESPFGDMPGVDGFSDLDWVLGYTEFFFMFVSDHGVGADEILPAWFVIVVPLVFGVALAVVYERRDPVVGCGDGARLGVTYSLLVSLVVVGRIGAQAREFERTYDTWPSEAVDTVNLLIAPAPRIILLGGIVYPVVFAALGGAVGAAVRDALESSDEPDRRRSQAPQRGRQAQPGNTSAGQPQQGQMTESEQQPQQPQPERQSSDRPERGSGPEQDVPDQFDQNQPGYLDQETSDESGQQPAEPPGSADDSGPGASGGDADTSGQELSPTDIIGDELGDDESEES